MTIPSRRTVKCSREDLPVRRRLWAQDKTPDNDDPFDFDCPQFVSVNDDLVPKRRHPVRTFFVLLVIAALSWGWLYRPFVRPDTVIYPLTGRIITSDYGSRIHPIKGIRRFHAGVDLRAPEGERIRAISGGRVLFSGKLAGYGKIVSIMHPDGLATYYAHCRDIFVKTGAEIAAGQVIGTVGKTGSATAPHLHLEVRVHGTLMDPKRLLPNLMQ